MHKTPLYIELSGSRGGGAPGTSTKYTMQTCRKLARRRLSVFSDYYLQSRQPQNHKAFGHNGGHENVVDRPMNHPHRRNVFRPAAAALAIRFVGCRLPFAVYMYVVFLVGSVVCVVIFGSCRHELQGAGGGVGFHKRV